MYINHSTKIPIRLSDEFIKEILINHNKIIDKSKNLRQENTNDGKWIFTQPSQIPTWN